MACGFGILASLMALGRDQVAYLFCVVLIARVLYAAAGSRRPLDYSARPLAGAAGRRRRRAAAILAAPVLLTLQFLASSNRPGIAFGVAAAGSLAPVNFATCSRRIFSARSTRATPIGGPAMTRWPQPDWTDRAVDYLFIGTAPMALWASGTGSRAGASSRAEMRFVHYMLAVALIYTLGRWTPLFEPIYDFFPGVSLYRRPADAAFVLNAGFALSAGYLLHRYIAHGAPRPFQKLPRPLAHALQACAFGRGARAHPRRARLLLETGHGTRGAGRRRPARSRPAPARRCVLVVGERLDKRGVSRRRCSSPRPAGELLWRNAADPLNAEPATRYSILDEPSPPERGAIAALRKDISERAAKGEHPRVEILGLPGGWQNASMMLGLEDTLGYNPLRISDYERAVGPGDNAVDPDLRHYPGDLPRLSLQARAAAGPRLSRARPPAGAHAAAYAAPQCDADLRLRPDLCLQARPRRAARLFRLARHRASIPTPPIAEDDIPDFDGAREALVDQADHAAARSRARRAGARRGRRRRSTIVSYEGERIRARRRDRIATGCWCCTISIIRAGRRWIDGAPAPIVKANILFRGVPTPEGRHRVEFLFRPFSLDQSRLGRFHAARSSGGVTGRTVDVQSVSSRSVRRFEPESHQKSGVVPVSMKAGRTPILDIRAFAPAP